MLPDYQQRVLEDKNELQSKCDRLAMFMHGNAYAALRIDERTRIQVQLMHMTGYLAILKERIRNFQLE